ncbi:MAG: hypothetical protein ACR2OY_10950, partial [Boseongicola sp.]
MSFFKTAVVTAALVTFGATAQAASWDFDADADTFWSNHNFEGTFDQVYNDSDSVRFGGNTSDGVTVSASAFGDDPFMDAGNAGLGVCSSGNSGAASLAFGAISDCSSGFGSNTDDDNLLYPEMLELVFSTEVWLTGLVVRDAGHNLITDAAAIEINGTSYSAINGEVQGLGGAGFLSVFTFTSAIQPCFLLVDDGG